MAMGLYGIAAMALLAGTSGGDELSAPSIAIGIVIALGFIGALVSYVCAHLKGHDPETIRGYFRDVQIVFTHMTLGVLSIFCVMFLTPGGLRYAQLAALPGWYLPVIMAISVHQFARAARRVSTRWRTVDDVAQGMRGAALTTKRFAATYDIGFFVSMSIATSIASRHFGSGQVLMLCGAIGALSFPFALGSMIYQRVVLARLLPEDMSLHDWDDLVSMPRNPGSVAGRSARRTRHVALPRRIRSRVIDEEQVPAKHEPMAVVANESGGEDGRETIQRRTE